MPSLYGRFSLDHLWPLLGDHRGGQKPLDLCHGLCHNPAIPARSSASLPVSLGHTQKAANLRETRMNAANPYHFVSSGIFGSDFAP
jgi:hypothetical protein